MLTKTCPFCGCVFKVKSPAFMKLRKFCSKRCAGKNIRHVQSMLPSEKQPSWKGGRSRGHGYVLIRTDPTKSGASAYEREHRLVMEKYLGRRLSDVEVVHHKNGIKTDNRIENLVVIGASEHTLLHAIEGGKKPLLRKACEVCGHTYKPNNQARRFCSRACYHEQRSKKALIS